MTGLRTLSGQPSQTLTGPSDAVRSAIMQLVTGFHLKNQINCFIFRKLIEAPDMEQKTEFFRWMDKMSVNSKEIDDQHRVLVGLLNEMYQAFMDREHKEKVGIIISKMADYTQYHFETEENYFAAFGYEDSEKHIAEHRLFKEKYMNLS